MKLKWVNFKHRVLRLLNIENCDKGRHPKDAIYYNEKHALYLCPRCGTAFLWHQLTKQQKRSLLKRVSADV